MSQSLLVNITILWFKMVKLRNADACERVPLQFRTALSTTPRFTADPNHNKESQQNKWRKEKNGFVLKHTSVLGAAFPLVGAGKERRKPHILPLAGDAISASGTRPSSWSHLLFLNLLVLNPDRVCCHVSSEDTFDHICQAQNLCHSLSKPHLSRAALPFW